MPGPVYGGHQPIKQSAAGSPSSGVNIGGFPVRVAVVNVPVQCTPMPVIAGEKVFIRPLPVNTKTVQIAMYRQAALRGPCDYVAPADTEREFPVEDLGQIYICQVTGAFVAGEGIAVNVRRSE